MPDSPLIPVIDLQQGIAVRAVGGKRNAYRSVRESGLPSDHPLDVARWYRDRYQFDCCYVADLDALQGQAPDLASLELLLNDGFSVITDAAWAHSNTIAIPQPLAQHPSGLRPIASLESLDQPDRLATLSERLGPQAIFSLDLLSGTPITPPQAPSNTTAPDWIQQAAQAGFTTILLLDLADVGTGQGTSTVELLRQTRPHFPQIRWWGGGSVRTQADVQRLLMAGFSSLLVASALFRGTLSTSTHL